MFTPGAVLDAATLLVMGVAAIFLGLLGRVAEAIPSSRVRTRVGVGVTLGLVAFSVVTAGLGGSRAAWLPPLVLAGVCGLFLASRAAAVRRAMDRAGGWASNPSVQWRALVLAGLALVVWYIFWATSNSPPTTTKPADDLSAQRARALAALRPEREWVALTDRGRQIRLLTMPESAVPPAMLEAMEAEVIEEWGRDLRLIRTSPTDRRSDCHGWVFVEGRWWILGDDVDTVLQDNDYERVAEPRPGDLVVYREGTAPVTHSGVVAAATQGGLVLIESKWASLGTYLHAPDAQPYGGQPQFYRSSRLGHRLNIMPSR